MSACEGKTGSDERALKTALLTHKRHAASRYCDHLVGVGKTACLLRQPSFPEAICEIFPPKKKTRTPRLQRETGPSSMPFRHGPEGSFVVRQIPLHSCVRLVLSTGELKQHRPHQPRDEKFGGRSFSPLNP